METEQIEALLGRLALAFENVRKTPESLAGARAWGQFLDGDTSHQQVGLYGTSAGILVRALAGRGSDSLADEVRQFVRHIWSRRSSDTIWREFLGQTTRLAFLNLALRVSRIMDGEGLEQEVEAELLGRLLPTGMWGDYWFDRVQDATPRLFPSAVTLLSFTLMRDRVSTQDPRLLRVADQLEATLLGNDQLPLFHVSTIAAAILATKGSNVNRKARARIRQMAYMGHADMSDLGVYFYDYEYPVGPTNRKSGRDYFIVPTEMMVGIAGFQAGAPSALRFRAENGIEKLVQNINQNLGMYRPAEQRVSSKNQAWAALMLKSSSTDHRPVAWYERVWHQLRRSRPENWFTLTLLPLLCIVDIVLGQIAEGRISPGEAVTLKILVPLLGLLTGKLYGKVLFRKLFLGREW
jgi:hypothetical protein